MMFSLTNGVFGLDIKNIFVESAFVDIIVNSRKTENNKNK